MDLQHKILELK